MPDTAEFRRALAETREYLLSHHEPADRYRCYSPQIAGHTVHLCARCSGVYPGILAGLLAFVYAPHLLTSLALVAVLPAPALVDWFLTRFTDRRGYNPVRTATGALLGYAYGLGLATLVVARDPLVIAVGFVYAVVAGCLLYVRLGSISK